MDTLIVSLPNRIISLSPLTPTSIFTVSPRNKISVSTNHFFGRRGLAARRWNCRSSQSLCRSAKRRASMAEPPRGMVSRAEPSGRARSTYRRARGLRTNNRGICRSPIAKNSSFEDCWAGFRMNGNCTRPVNESWHSWASSSQDTLSPQHVRMCQQRIPVRVKQSCDHGQFDGAANKMLPIFRLHKLPVCYPFCFSSGALQLSCRALVRD